MKNTEKLQKIMTSSKQIYDKLQFNDHSETKRNIKLFV